MTSTEVNLGFAGRNRPSSRVLKPPGGGHSNIFAESDVKPNPPRPKYDQQNSSNLNFVMNTTDPNEAVVKTRQEIEVKEQHDVERHAVERAAQDATRDQSAEIPSPDSQGQGGRTRVPPGGFSSGLW